MRVQHRFLPPTHKHPWVIEQYPSKDGSFQFKKEKNSVKKGGRGVTILAKAIDGTSEKYIKILI